MKDAPRPATSVFASILQRPVWIGGVVIVLAFVTMTLAINPVHNFPVQDDWDYSRSVKIFLETGRIQRSDISQATLVFPTVYGALVSRVFGFSFTTLRCSTLALALIALLAFYALLGELGFDWPRRVIATLTLLATPPFIYLSFSFMTDIPALCWLIVATWFYTRALKYGAARPAVIGAASAALAFLTRQTGIFLPLAFGAMVLWRLPRMHWLKHLTAGCLLPLAVVGVYVLAPGQNSVTNWATQNITLGITLREMAQPATWGVYLRRVVQASMTVGLYLAPIFLALLFSARKAIRALTTDSRALQVAYLVMAGLGAAAIARLAARRELFPYLTDIWTRSGLRPYLAFVAWEAGALREEIFPRWVFIGLTTLAGVVGLALLFLAVRHSPRLWSRRATPELHFIFLLTVAIAGPTLIFATFYERYLLPLMLGALILLLDTARQERFSVRASAVSLAVIAAFSWALMQDYWGWNEARWRVGRELLAEGIPAHKIDGGLEWDGWYLYDVTVEYVHRTGKPFIFDPWQYVLDPEYVFTFQPLKNYRILRTVRFATWFPDGKFYLAIRAASPPAPEASPPR